MTTVVLKEGESQQELVKRFRRKVTKARILSTVKKRRYYISKSERKRMARRKAIRKERRRQWKRERRYRR